MATLRVFKSTVQHCNYVLKNGQLCVFAAGVFRTSDPDTVKELEDEISKKHPHIYIDQNEREIDETMVDPMNVLRAKIISEFLAAQAAATDPKNDMGSTDKNAPLMPATSRDVASAAAGGSGATVFVSPTAKK